MAAGTGLGLSSAFPTIKFFAMNRSDSTTVIGAPYSLLLGKPDAEPEEMGADTLYEAGSATDDLTAQIITGLARSVRGLHVVALTVAADDTPVLVLLRGITNAVVRTSLLRGAPVIHDGPLYRFREPTLNTWPMDGFLLQDVSTEGRAWILFDGFQGFSPMVVT